jgi:UDP-GlcNAc:undecaprenyl-phosphate GlcNAc-1-phosphate transferase
LGLVDHPDLHRKLHQDATPLGGGVAVLVSSVGAVVGALILSDSQRSQAGDNAWFLAGILSAAIVLCLIGLIDDRFGLRGRQKLLGQFVAAGIVLASGMIIERVEIFGISIELGVLSAPLTLFWLLGAINAVNLIDGMDGLATSVGLVLSIAVAVMASLSGHATEAFLALALAGALTGFLVYNSPPASIFLGDAGSMIIGLVLGAIAIRSAIKGPATVVLAAPTAIWAIPIFDVAMAILRRKLTGRSIYTTDRGHLHHTLQHRGFSDRKVVIVVGAFCCVTAIGASLSVYLHNELMAYGAIVGVCAVLVVTRLFGHHESLLLVKRLKGLFQSFIPSISKDKPRSDHNIQTRLRGNRQWEDLWESLTTYGECFKLNAIDLNVSLPGIGEEFHASWRRRNGEANEAKLWRSDIPLHAHDMAVGRLRIIGTSGNFRVFAQISDLIGGLSPMESHIIDLLDCVEEAVTSTPDLPEYSAALSTVGGAGVSSNDACPPG